MFGASTSGRSRGGRTALWLALGLALALPSGPAAAAPPPPSSTDAAAPAKPAAAKPAAVKPTAAPADAGGAAPASDGLRQTEAYGERLDGLEAEANALKDKIFRSKARLSVLRSTVLAGAMAGSRVLLSHRNLMGTGFQLTKITYYLDGAPVFVRRDEGGGLDQQDEIVIFDGNLAPGRHLVGVELIYKGKGYGRFSYLRGYTFQASATHEVDVGDRGAIKVVSVGFERGNVTTEMGDRPSVDWQVVVLDASGRPQKPAPDARTQMGGAAKVGGEAKAGGEAKGK